MAILSIGFACFDQFFFLNEWPRRIPKTFVMILLKAAAVRRPMRHRLLGLWGEEVYYIGHLQQDLYGQRIIDEFAEAGVDTSRWFSPMT